MLFDPRLREDLARYPAGPWFKEQSVWAVAVHRFGNRVDARRRGPVRWVTEKLYWVLFRLVETVTGISIPKSVNAGGGLRIHHFGCIFIHKNTRIGRKCTLRQGVTLGNRHNDGGAPVIGDDVEFGAFAQVLGLVRIGNGAKIGSMSVVLKDVPDGATVVGVPARIVATRPDGEHANNEVVAAASETR
jgi:serine O-acetyltransferase